MQLLTKWNLRQVALGGIHFILSATGFIMALALIRVAKWKAFGLAVFGKEVPTAILLGTSPTWYYFKENILPLFPLLVLAILLDYFVVNCITQKLLE